MGSGEYCWADLALSGMMGRLALQIDAKRSVPQEQKPRSKKIFVGGLAPDTSEGTFTAQALLEWWMPYRWMTL